MATAYHVTTSRLSSNAKLNQQGAAIAPCFLQTHLLYSLMFHPFIDATSLSDDELFKRMSRCQEIIYSAMQSGQGPMYESALIQYETYQAEYNERTFKKKHEEDIQHSPDGNIEIGTISDLSPLRGETDGKSNNRGQPQKRR